MTENSIEKWARTMSSNNSLKKDIKVALYHKKKMLNLTQNKRNTNCNYSEIAFSPNRLAKIKKPDNHCAVARL